MKKVLKGLGIVLVGVYLVVAITLTVFLLNYNKYNITELNNKSLIIVRDEELKPDFQKGDLVIVDGIEGIAIINPSEEVVAEYKAKKEAFAAEQEELKKLIEVKTVTKSGKRVEVCGNIGKPEDIDQVLANGGDGVGLFRTEFLYMESAELPTEEQQFEVY